MLIDQRSRYAVVTFTTSIDGTSLIKVLENVFTQYGLPDRIMDHPLHQQMLRIILKVREYIIKK